MQAFRFFIVGILEYLMQERCAIRHGPRMRRPCHPNIRISVSTSRTLGNNGTPFYAEKPLIGDSPSTSWCMFGVCQISKISKVQVQKFIRDTCYIVYSDTIGRIRRRKPHVWTFALSPQTCGHHVGNGIASWSTALKVSKYTSVDR